MNILKRLLLGLMLLSSFLSKASARPEMAPNILPAPAWIQAVEITESKIKVEWAIVSGAVEYRVSRFDVTNNVQLPDVFMVEEEYTSEPHAPGTTIQFEVSAKDGNGDFGPPVTGEYTTSIIIVDNIASFSVPNVPGGAYYIQPGGLLELSVSDADKTASDVIVNRVKLSFGTHFAEFLVWSHCIDQDNPGTRIQYYQENNWPSSVSKVEIGSPDQGYSKIIFRINQESSFFTLFQPSYIQEYDQAKLVIQNNMKGSSQILYQRSTNTEDNPCYVPGYQGQGSPETLDEESNSDGSDEASSTASVTQIQQEHGLTVTPNPFHDGLKIDYEVAQSGAVRLLLVDLTGRTIQNIAFDNLESGTYTAYMTTNTLPAGMYLLTLQTESACTTVPVVKH